MHCDEDAWRGQKITIHSHSAKLDGKRAQVVGFVNYHPAMHEFQARIQGNNLTGSAIEVRIEGQSETVLIDAGELPPLFL
jgi:hypothetical protein